MWAVYTLGSSCWSGQPTLLDKLQRTSTSLAEPRMHKKRRRSCPKSHPPALHHRFHSCALTPFIGLFLSLILVFLYGLSQNRSSSRVIFPQFICHLVLETLRPTRFRLLIKDSGCLPLSGINYLRQNLLNIWKEVSFFTLNYCSPLLRQRCAGMCIRITQWRRRAWTIRSLKKKKQKRRVFLFVFFSLVLFPPRWKDSCFGSWRIFSSHCSKGASRGWINGDSSVSGGVWPQAVCVTPSRILKNPRESCACWLMVQRGDVTTWFGRFCCWFTLSCFTLFSSTDPGEFRLTCVGPGVTAPVALDHFG